MSFVARLSTRLLPLKQAVSRALSHVFPRLNYLIWAWRNPGKNFKTFYAESITAALEGRKKHASLGPKLKDDRNEVALRTFKQLIAQGISPNDTVVDYGCGTLRIGRPFIEFLEPDRYIGMDIDERILDAGRRSLTSELIVSKRPALEVISPDSVMRAAARRPRWIFSKGVLQHVPPAELDEYFCNLAHMVRAGAVAFLYARCGKESSVLSSKSWKHDIRQLQENAALHGMALDAPTRTRKFLRLQTLGAALLSMLQLFGTDFADIVLLSV